MRIAFLTPTLGEAFGQEKVLQDSVRLLEATGHRCLVLTEKKIGSVPAYLRYEICEGLSLVHNFTNSKAVRETHAVVLQHLNNFSPDLVHYVDLFDYRLLDEISNLYPSVLTAHSVSASCPASHRMLKDCVACEAQSGWGCLAVDFTQKCLSHFKSPLHKAHAVQNFLLKKNTLKNRFKKVIAISHYMKEVLVRDGFDPSKIEVIYNPVLENKNLPSVSVPSSPLILSAGRLIPLKGVDQFIEALSLIKDTDFVAWIVGEGSEKENLQSLVDRLKLSEKVIFKGRMPSLELDAVRKQASLFVQTNRGPEGFGLSLAESMMQGLPSVTHDIAALNELVKNGRTGFLCPVGDTKFLAKKMKEILNQKELRERFSQEARRVALENFSARVFLEKTEKIYREVAVGTISTDSKIFSKSFA